MPDKKLVKLLLGDVAAWNKQQDAIIEDGIHFDLTNANLRGAVLKSANLIEVDLRGADLSGAHLWGARLISANLCGANLSGADLHFASLNHANLIDANATSASLVDASLLLTDLSRADLSGANLASARLRRTHLLDTKLTHAYFAATIFEETDLTGVIDLETCTHGAPSIIDFPTLRRSGQLPLAFLQGIGLPDNFIDYLPSLLGQAIQYYSCFISYSTKDDDFAKRLHADLQSNGVRCWFAPHDLRIGDKFIDEIDAAIRLRDKVVLVLSENSINSDWVEDEVTTAYEEERKRGQTVLFPIRVDDAVVETKEAWAAKLRARHIGDFSRWKNHDNYQRTFQRVLRDLTTPK